MRDFCEDKAVARLAEILALECGVHSKIARQIFVATTLHDIGKQRIPESILNKPGKLTREEFEVIKTHTTLGAEMLASFHGSLSVMAREIALHHHEYWDGAGGYWGKYIDELPCYVQFAAIADVFVALVCARSYKQAWPPREALGYISSKIGTQFSPAIVKVFIPLVESDSRVKAIFEEVDNGTGRCSTKDRGSIYQGF